MNRYEGDEHWYHASGAGGCSRKLYFESVLKSKPSNPIKNTSLRLMRLGTIVHDDIQGALQVYNTSIYKGSKEKENNKEKEIEFKVEEELTIDTLNVRGFCDIIAKDNNAEDKKVYLYDVKTAGTYSWKFKFGRAKSFNPSIHYELQLGTYGYAIQQKYGRLDGMFLWYYNKDSSVTRVESVPLTYTSRAYLYWKNINDEHKMGLPMFKKGVSPVQEWQCKYCQFLDLCKPPK